MDGDEHGEVEESSSKRRERLLVLRSAANASPAAAAAPPPPAPAPSLLPDLDLAGDHQDANPHAQKPHRFDFYTNPGAAFSSGGGGGNPTYPHKRKSPPACYAPNPAPPALQPQPYAGPGNYGSNYPPPSQHHMAHRPPSPMAQDAPGSGPWRSPMQFQDPMSGYQGTPPGAPSWAPRSGSAGRGSYPNSPGFGFRHPPNPVRGGSPMSNYGPRSSPSHASYGRGRGHNYNYNSPGSWGRGGGVGFQNYSGQQQDRRSFMSKSMVDDPWQDLQPIVGNILIPRGGGSNKSWLPESLREKKETTPGHHHGQIKPTSSSGLSLAEYLDLSFNEASNEA